MSQPKIIEFNKISDPRGNLTFLQHANPIPFEIQRIFYTYNVPGGEIRGGHAYKEQKEIIIALSGSFDVIVKDKKGIDTRFTLNRSYFGLYIPEMTWRHIENFSTNSVSLHLSSSLFNELDYIRDINKYLEN